MMSFKRTEKDLQVPVGAVWLMNSIAECKGKQELYTRQSPQILKALVDIALIESAESSNRIEGVTIDKRRLKPLLLGHSKPRDRSEEEIAGYRKALDLIHRKHGSLDVSAQAIRELHHLSHSGAVDAGEWKKKDNDIIGKYISLERIIEQSKETYYEALQKSSLSWHNAKHNIEPWLFYFLGTLNSAYREFQERAVNIKSIRGAKTEIVIQAINHQWGEFSISDIEKLCPGISRDMVRVVFRQLQKEKKIACLGKGQSAKWKRIGRMGQ